MTVARIPRLLTVADVAKRSSLSPWTIRREIKAGRLKARRVRGAIRVVDEEVTRWMRSSDDQVAS